LEKIRKPSSEPEANLGMAEELLGEPQGSMQVLIVEMLPAGFRRCLRHPPQVEVFLQFSQSDGLTTFVADGKYDDPWGAAWRFAYPGL